MDERDDQALTGSCELKRFIDELELSQGSDGSLRILQRNQNTRRLPHTPFSIPD